MEAEESLAEKEQIKRKQDAPEERGKRRRKFCLLENWGEASSQVEEKDPQETETEVRDWLVKAENNGMETKQMTQTDIASWLGGKAKEDENLPEEQKKETPVRARGKLTKKEEKAMKKCHPPRYNINAGW